MSGVHVVGHAPSNYAGQVVALAPAPSTSVLFNSPCVCGLDAGGQIVFVNQNDLAGLLVGRQFPEFFELQARAAVRSAIEQVMRKDSPTHYHCDVMVRGQLRVCRWTFHPLASNSGMDASVLAIPDDKVAPRKDPTRIAHKDRLATLGLLSSSLAHDLNNTLTPIVMVIDHLKTQASLTPGAISLLDVGFTAVNQASALIRQIIMLAQGGQESPEPIQIGPVISDLENFLRHSLRKNIIISTDVRPGIPPFRAIPVHVFQVLLNLCVNAQDAMPDGGTLSIKADRSTMPQDSEWQDGGGPAVRISVCDTGTGILPEVLPHIFKPFFTTKEQRRSGAGVGLATVKSLVESAGGWISVETSPGNGSTFLVSFPASALMQQRAAAEA